MTAEKAPPECRPLSTAYLHCSTSRIRTSESFTSSSFRIALRIRNSSGASKSCTAKPDCSKAAEPLIDALHLPVHEPARGHKPRFPGLEGSPKSECSLDNAHCCPSTVRSENAQACPWRSRQPQ